MAGFLLGDNYPAKADIWPEPLNCYYWPIAGVQDSILGVLGETIF